MSFYCFYFISIHAPTRGATLSTVIVLNISEFQSTLPREERPCTSRLCLYIYNFNPRSHERSDLVLCHSYRIYLNFNPRSHERSDLILVLELVNYVISIHAPTRGATLCGFQFCILFQISIHAPTRGAT